MMLVRDIYTFEYILTNSEVESLLLELNLIKKYVDLPAELTSKQIAYDLTLRTVEVESVEDISEKYNFKIIASVSLDESDLSDSLKSKIAVSL